MMKIHQFLQGLIHMEDQVTRIENWFSSLLIAIVLIVSGLLLVFLAGRDTSLSCIRTVNEVNCLMTSRLLKQYSPRETAVNHLQTAMVEESCDEDCSYRVLLYTDNIQVPLTNTFDSNRIEKQQKVDQINQFLNDNSQSSITLISEAGLWPYAGIALTVIGLFISLWTGGKVLLNIFRNR